MTVKEGKLAGSSTQLTNSHHNLFISVGSSFKYGILYLRTYYSKRKQFLNFMVKCVCKRTLKQNKLKKKFKKIKSRKRQANQTF